ncbi:hypothetical protein [Stenotrophomonas pictorum]|uniref:hypothetical protein n=1 Tax=Stenotrophomonas pictorum TaxID=86184 RepID=UPI000A81A0E9|nr:hypothetical protein [Stenotrophomonas pictorum]
MLTHYRAGRLVAKIFIRLAWAILMAFALILLIGLPGYFLFTGNSIAGSLQLLPHSVFPLLPLTYACLATVLFGHVALAVFDMADAARKTG